MNKTFLGAFALTLLGAAAVACSSTDTSTPDPDGGITPVDGGADGAIDPATCPATGSAAVTVTVTGLPAGTAPKVSAKNSAGVATDVSGGATLPAGVYTVEAANIGVTDPRARSAYKGTVSSASSVCVKDGVATTITASYALIETSNKLWVLNANRDDQLLGFKSSDIATTGGADAPVGSKLENPNGIAFDKDGGIWATADVGGAKTISHYTAASLGAGGTPTPDITVQSTALNFGAPSSTNLAFDPNGNLWVSAAAAHKVLRFDAAKLKASGTFEPTVVLGDDAGNAIQLPSALAFDAEGNLWIADSGFSRVAEYKAARLTASQTTAPDVVLTVAGLVGTRGLAFDGSNNLWANFDKVIVKLTPADRAATGTPVPSVKIVLDPNALPENLAFDESGSLWFAYSQSSIARMTSTQLTTSTPDGSNASPEIVVSSIAIGSATDIAIYPAPANTPMFSRLP